MKMIGLTMKEALKNRENGTNKLTQRKAVSFWNIFSKRMQNTWIKILIIALALEVIFNLFGNIWLDTLCGNWINTIVTFIVVLVSVICNSFIEYKQECKVQNLKYEANRMIMAKVYRNGSIMELPIKDIVLGECIYLEAGDKIPANGILIEGSLKVDQSNINGESGEIEKLVLKGKNIPSSDDIHTKFKCFRGSVVTFGSAIMQVTDVGDSSISQIIKNPLKEKGVRKTPLEGKLNILEKRIEIFGYCAGAIVGIINLFLSIVDAKSNQSILYAICAIIIGIGLGVTTAVVAHKLMSKLRAIFLKIKMVNAKFGMLRVKKFRFLILGLLNALTYLFQLLAVLVVLAIDITKIMGVTFGTSVFDILTSMVLAISVIVMNISDMLPIMNVIIQFFNVDKMFKSHIYAKNPSAIEWRDI